MTSYKEIQFIGYAVSTKAALCGGGDNNKYYLGNTDESADLAARLSLVKTALQGAGPAWRGGPETLKVFVIPEFFFRGALGAYSGTQNEAYLKEGLRALKAEFAPSIDMAVWGTSLFATQKADYTSPAVEKASRLGDAYLALYEACREARSAAGKKTPDLKDMLFFLDELEAWEDSNTVPQDLPAQDPLFWVIKDLLAGCDRNAPVEVVNKAQILLEGEGWLSVQKRFKSKVDFVLNYYHDAARTKANRDAFLQTFVRYPPVAPSVTEEKVVPLDQYSVFNWRGLKVGIEICLDHVRQRLALVRSDLDLQLLPSCGVEVMPSAVAARVGGYVFNCDGDYTLADACNGLGAHSQLFRVVEAGDAKVGKEAKLGKRIEPERVIKVGSQGIENYYPEGAGELHVYVPQPLN